MDVDDAYTMPSCSAYVPPPLRSSHLSTALRYLWAQASVWGPYTSSLTIALSSEVDLEALLFLLRTGFRQLVELDVSTSRSAATSLFLESFHGLSPKLSILRVKGNKPVIFTAGALEEFLGLYPRMRTLSINPSPRDSTVDSLPRLDVLEVIGKTPRASALEEFGALLRLDEAAIILTAAISLFPTPILLDLGKSRICGDRTRVAAYIHRLFPHVNIRAVFDDVRTL